MNGKKGITTRVRGQSLLVIVVSWLAWLNPCFADLDVSRPAPESGGPTEVEVSVFLVDIDEINSAEQTFTVNLYYDLSWKDPRLTHASAGVRRYSLGSVWSPNVQLVNQQKLWDTMPTVVEVQRDGTVTYRQRAWGAFSQRLDLRAFPFDTQQFDIVFGAVESPTSEVAFVQSPLRPTGVAQILSLQDWTLDSWKVGAGVYEPIPGDTGTSAWTFSFVASRESNYYISKVILPLLMILIMATSVFWIDPEEGGVQIGVASSAMLTLIAYRFAIGTDLPKIPYLTRMDIFILVSTVMVAVGLVEVVTTSHLAKTGRTATARRIDVVMRWSFPILVVLVGLLSFLWQ